MVVGHHLLFGVHDDERMMLKQTLDAMVEGHLERTLVTYRAARPDSDAWRWVEASVALVHDDDGAPTEIISAVRDISKRKALEIELAAARERAEGGGEGEVAIPRQYEPRDPHPDERRAGLCRPAARRRPRARSAPPG
ncbi:PAS domain S-box protein [Sphingomonas panacisoli]|nr:PAS domain S-box protein [Sphingomonas panacisoli]